MKDQMLAIRVESDAIPVSQCATSTQHAWLHTIHKT